MKGKIRYQVEDRMVEKEVSYIPFRNIAAVLIALLEVAAILTIVIVLCKYVPYFYLLVWATEIACVIRIIASDDNPDYKIQWLMLVLLVPVAGFMCYFLFYSRKLKRKYVRRLSMLKQQGTSDDSAAFANPGSRGTACRHPGKNALQGGRFPLVFRYKSAVFPSG